MYELIALTEHDYYVDCPAKIGITRIGDTNEVLFIDGGSDADAAKKALRAAEAHGWHLRAVINTHSHADHIGGNHYLQSHTGCRIFASGLEVPYACHPIFEPMGLWGGNPPRDLRTKFFLAADAAVEPLDACVLPQGYSILPLPGHSFDMVGLLTPDGTAYIADAVASPETLAKYGVTFLYDVNVTLETLAKLPALGARRYVPAHAAVTEDIAPIAQCNADAIERVKALIASLCRTPQTTDSLLTEVFRHYGVHMSVAQYVLVGSTLRSYLSSLSDAGLLRIDCREDGIFWVTV